MAKTITTNGNAQVDTAQSKFGGASGLFDGDGDYLTIPDHDDFDFGTADFTIDWWMKTTDTTFYQCVLQKRGATEGVDGSYSIMFNDGAANGHLHTWFEVSGGVVELIGTTSLIDGSWHHVAIVRNSGTWKLYINGVNESTVVNSADSLTTANEFLIGRDYFTSPGRDYGGWLDELRISKGIARWTANFTPETSAYTCADSYTKLLVHCDGADASTTFTDDDTACSISSILQNNLLLMGVG